MVIGVELLLLVCEEGLSIVAFVLVLVEFTSQCSGAAGDSTN